MDNQSAYQLLWTLLAHARIVAAAARANARIAGMQALNQERERDGKALAYGEVAFVVVLEEEGISHNAVEVALSRFKF